MTWRAQGVYAGAALVVMTLAAYAPVSSSGIIWDDNDYVFLNDTLRSLGGLGRIWLEGGATPQYYPLVFTSFWIEYRLWGLDPLGYHAVNVLLHATCALLLWRVLRHLGLGGAWLAAAVFALHPVHVESVAWITERKNVLSGALYLASMLCYLRFDHPNSDEIQPRRSLLLYGASLLLFAGALASKTVTLSLPAVLILILWWKKRFDWRAGATLIPFIAIGIPCGILTVWMERHHVGASGPDWDFSPIDRILIAGRALWFYASKLAWPHPLVFNYPRWSIDPYVWWQYLYPAAAMSVVATLWWRRATLGRGPLVAVLVFAGTLVPALGFFDVYPMRYSFVADHFQYLASIALVALAVEVARNAVVSNGRLSAPAGWAAAAGLLTVLGVLTWREIPEYQNPITLWRATIAENPDSWLAHSNLGMYLAERGELSIGIGHQQRAIELKPDFATAYDNLGTALARLGDTNEAIRNFRQALELEPGRAATLTNLGNALISKRRFTDAIEAFERSLELRPDNVVTLNNLGNLMVKRDRKAGVRYLERAIESDPEFAQAHFNLAGAVAPDDPTRAVDSYETAARHFAGDGNLRFAQRSLERALELTDEGDGLQRKEIRAKLMNLRSAEHQGDPSS
jgi:tetratricopeptide (TPR) repeat protein